MWIMLGTKTKCTPVKGGQRHRAVCPDCKVETEFREAVRKETFTAFAVLDLLDSEERVFICAECLQAFALQDGQLPAPEPTPEERTARLLDEAEKHKHDRAVREARAEIELDALKERMGLGPTPSLAAPKDHPDDSASPMKKWWKVWKR